MPNESFFNALREGYKHYKRSEKSKYSWSQETVSSETKTFIFQSGLEAFSTTDSQPTPAQMALMATQLFSYCMSRNREQEGKVASGNLLYTFIFQQLVQIKSSENKTDNQIENSAFVYSLTVAIANHFAKWANQFIPVPHLWIADVDQMLDILLGILFPPSQINDQKIKIFSDSNLITLNYRSLPIGQKSLFLEYPIIAATLQQSKDLTLGFNLLKKLRTEADESSIAIYENWAQLLFLKGIRIDATLGSKNFIQVWHSTIYGESIFFRLNRLLKDPAFARIDTASQGALLSLSSDSLSSAESRTALQDLTLYYGLVSTPQEVDTLIITLLEKNVTILHETDALWIEPLIENAKDVESYRKILNKIPDSMLHDFYNRGLHLKLAGKLAEKIQHDPEDFWTQTQDKKVDRYPILNETIQKIVSQRQTLAISTHAALDVVNDYNRKYTEFKTYTTAKALNSVAASAPHNFTPILTAVQTAKSNQLAAQNANDFLSVQCQILQINNEINYQHWQLITTYLVTNIIGTPLPEGQNNNLMHNFEESDQTSDSKSLMHNLITQNNSLALDDYYKKEISLSIQKSLTRWLVNNFPIYNAGTDHRILIDNFIIFNKNLEYILKAFNLEFNEIILNNPISKSILTDTCKILLAFSTLAEKNKLATLKFYAAITMPTDTMPDVFILLYTLQTQADSYLSVVGGANHYAKRMIGGNKTNLLYATFIQKTKENKENKEKSILIPVTVIMSILDFIITSHTSEKFQKEFFEEYLRETLEDSKETLRLLAPYKDFFIAQINLSLKKLELAHYKAPERAKNLYAVLASVVANFSIKTIDLDVPSRTILTYSGMIIFFKKLEMGSKEAINISNSFAHYYQNPPVTKEFVSLIIPALLKYNDINDFQSILTAHSRVFKEYGENNFIITALKYKDETFNGFEYLLEGMTQYPTHFKNIWLQCLELGYVPTAREFKGKPLISYLALSRDSEETLNNIESLFNNAYFNNLDSALKSEILSAAYASAPPYKSACVLRCNSNITSIQELFMTDFSNGSSSKTFNPNLWHGGYDTTKPITHETKFTPLKRLTFVMPNRPITPILEQIINILKVNPVIAQEESQHGYWIESLLTQTRLISEENKKTIIDTVYPNISQKMWGDFFDMEILQKMLYNLNNYTDPLADAPADHTSYGLYVRLLLEATFRCPEKAMAITGFIGTLCKHQLFYLETDDYLTRKLSENSVNAALKEAITQALAKAKDIKVGILGIKNKAEPAFKNAAYVCSMVKEFLFLPLSAFTNNNINYIHVYKFTVEQDAHTAIYASIEKSINHTLTFASEKWQSYDFVIGFLKFMSSLVDTLKLDQTTILPEACIDKIVACILWKQKYKEDSNPYAFVNFRFIWDKIEEQFKTLHAYTQEHATCYDTFMTSIITNTEAYQATTSTNPFTQTANKECAAFIVARNQYGTTLLNNPEAKNIAFIKTLTKIIHYRIQGYARADYEKGLYKTSLKAPLELLKTQNLQFPEFYQQQFYIEIKNALQTMLKDNTQTFDSDRSTSLHKTIALFSKICGLDDTQKDDLDALAPAIVSTGVYASYNGSSSRVSGSFHSPYSTGVYTGYYGGYGFGGF